MDIRSFFLKKKTAAEISPQGSQLNLNISIEEQNAQYEATGNINDDSREEITNTEVVDTCGYDGTSSESESPISKKANLAKPKRLVKFKMEWINDFDWLIKGKDEYSGKCVLCSVNFTIGHGGRHDVIKHAKSQAHLKNIQSCSSSKMTTYFAINNSSEELDTTAAETGFIYHAITHSQSYVATDCAGSLFSSLFKDSKIASQYRCGRTKCSKIVSKVLGPESKKRILKEINEANYFSVSTDASNKGNIKTFPLIISYFNKTFGTKNALLSFYSLDSEKSISIANSIIVKINFNELSMENVTSFCADNANVNFGKKQSVLTELTKVNENIIPIGCNCHILSNTLKKGISSLRKIDIDVIVIKIFNEFSSSTKCTAELKEMFEWTNCEWSELLRHVSTRWLSLYPAIERLIKNFEPLKCYFLSKSNVSPTIKMFFENEISMAYLGFAMHYCTIFQTHIKSLEKSGGMGVETFKIMCKVREALRNRHDQEFYGSIARSFILKCNDINEVKRFEIEAKNALKISLEYLEKWFDYENNVYKHIMPLSLAAAVPSFSDIQKIAKKFNIKNVDENVLFEEYIKLRKFADDYKDLFQNQVSSDQKWVQFFKTNPLCKNLEIIVCFVYSVPHSNASAERVFSLMNNAWRKERQSLLIENLEAELMIKENFKMTCLQFRKFLQTQEGILLLKKAMSNNKYK